MMIFSEYDAFGPWIYEINEKYSIPPLFLPYYNEGKNHLMLVKIPRNIERRDASPDMDLYDYVIGMYDDFIYILERKDKLVEESRVFYNDITGINDLRDLLLGRLTIHMKDSTLIIPYNTVSGEIISSMIKIIRERISKQYFNEAQINEFDKELEVDDLYKNLLYSMSLTEKDIKVGAVQKSIMLAFSRGNFFQRLLRLITGEKLLNSLHLYNAKELIIISRSKLFKKYHDTIYGYSILYIPIEKIDGISYGDNIKYPSLKEFNLDVSNKTFKFYLEENNKEFIEFYSSLEQARAAGCINVN